MQGNTSVVQVGGGGVREAGSDGLQIWGLRCCRPVAGRFWKGQGCEQLGSTWFAWCLRMGSAPLYSAPPNPEDCRSTCPTPIRSLQLERQALERELGVQLRDFRVLDAVLGASYPSCILVRWGKGAPVALKGPGISNPAQSCSMRWGGVGRTHEETCIPGVSSWPSSPDVSCLRAGAAACAGGQLGAHQVREERGRKG